jgi:hypothetical protein
MTKLRISPFEDRSFRLPRVWSNHVLRAIAPRFTGEVINISGWLDSDKAGGRYRDYFSGASKYYISNHAGERGLADAAATTDFAIDLEAPVPADRVGRFDVVFNHTTLEHVFDMFAAFDHLCAMTRDVVVVVVPFAQRMHRTSSFGDYWRISPEGLRRLFERNGLTSVFEAANDHWNAGLYVVGVGAKHPDRWRGVLEAPPPIQRHGDWIGKNPLRRVLRALGRDTKAEP